MQDVVNIIKYTYPLNLLYVEDNQEAREAVLMIFEDFFENIVVSVNGEDGLNKFKTQNIDLIITDINMPKLNGLDMIREIRDIDNEVPILVLSAYNDSDFFMDSIKLDVDGYLLKPVDIKQFVFMMRKITDKLRLKDQAQKNLYLLQQYQEIADISAIVSKIDPSGIITYANDAFALTTGYTKDELIGQNHSVLGHPDNSIGLYKEIWDTIKNQKKIWTGILKNITKNASTYYAKTSIKPIVNQNGDIVEYILLRYNVTDIINPRRQLQDLVDSLNETLVVVVKIDSYEDIQGFYGLKLLQIIEENFSKVILKLIPKLHIFDNFFALDNGEFAFVTEFNNLINPEDVIIEMKKLQSNIDDSILTIDHIDYDISIIVSIAYGKNTIENVNYGLKKAQKLNQDFIVANNFIQNEHIQAQKNLKIIKMLKKAIEDSKLISHYQPIVDTKTKEILKYESLVRLIDINGEIVPPLFFLDVAKKGKYYAQITIIVLENSFKALKLTDKEISINISVLDIEKRVTREKIFELLKNYSKEANRITFELLESENVEKFEQVKSFINYVKNLGVKIAIDDFGAGYSNFERLLDYQPDIIKIDGSLIKNIQNSELSLNIVETISSFAKKQNIQVIAEYVENEEIFHILRDMGIDYLQGYYFGKPKELAC